jgi:hypothetical protein
MFKSGYKRKVTNVNKLQPDCTPDTSAISFAPLHIRMMLSNAVRKTDVQR